MHHVIYHVTKVAPPQCVGQTAEKIKEICQRHRTPQHQTQVCHPVLLRPPAPVYALATRRYCCALLHQVASPQCVNSREDEGDMPARQDATSFDSSWSSGLILPFSSCLRPDSNLFVCLFVGLFVCLFVWLNKT